MNNVDRKGVLSPSSCFGKTLTKAVQKAWDEGKDPYWIDKYYTEDGYTDIFRVCSFSLKRRKNKQTGKFEKIAVMEYHAPGICDTGFFTDESAVEDFIDEHGPGDEDDGFFDDGVLIVNFAGNE